MSKKIAVIYARYSSDKQREESIEAQLKVCHAYAEQKGYLVRNEYIDRALSGRRDDRPQFQIMIKNSKKKNFEKVIVYRLDRFSRDIYDFAEYKKALLKNDVKLESATEYIPDNSLGIMVEAIISGGNASYSVELAEKVKRNMDLNAEKCLSNGGTVPLGFKLEKIDPTAEKSKKKYVIDEETAPIVKEIFTKYADGKSIKEICDSLNERQLKSSKGVAFNKNSLHSILKSRKYLGIYIYDGKEIPGGMPQIIDEVLFKKVQDKMGVNKKLPARARAKVEYLLTGKLFCGHCKEMMIGHSTTKNSVIKYSYYNCKNHVKGKSCKKKMADKNYIEDVVINKCREQLDPKNIRRIAKEAVKVAESFDDNTEIKRLRRLLKEAQEAQENQMSTLRTCKDELVKGMIIDDLGVIGKNIMELGKQLEIETARRDAITEEQVIKNLTRLANGDLNDIVYRRALIRLLVAKIYLYDDKIIYTFNTSEDEVEITDIFLSEIEENLGDKEICVLNATGHHDSPAITRHCCGSGWRICLGDASVERKVI